ncbi:MAG: enoyl-CoA hydratase [Candidatus Abyssobacteria bacterium SURF_17]|uniref:Enoyl-CoA hydratase n=1 Tax=Candidatus Abyssobacteria bacterium SURF_17 TaxID=2093361 RepID=A0A419EZ85_9BACT|nr:MAG: enoyl-CoA hydratase [Candidatus Abyssubacteria bacterium SURF_17]
MLAFTAKGERHMDYSRYKNILVERKDRILRLILNRPESLNAVTPAMHAELATLFADVRRDSDADVVILTGAGRGFCAGADLKEPPPDKKTAERIFEEARDIIVNILEVDKPIISAVNGPAAGLGATLALFPDIVVMSDRAKIGDTHVKVGLAAGDGGAVIWPILVGVNKAKELLMTGQVIDAQEALRIGLVNHVVPHEKLDEFVTEMAQRLASGNTFAIRCTKKAVNQYVKWMLNQVFDYSLALEYQCGLRLFPQTD